MVDRFPHTVSVFVSGNTPVRDSNGDWLPNQPLLSFIVKGRAESSTGNGYITDVDGKQISYSWVIYFGNTSMSNIPTGSTIFVDTSSNNVLTGTVKRFSKGQLNCRAWV